MFAPQCLRGGQNGCVRMRSNTPTQDLAQPAIDLSRALDIIEILAVLGLLQKSGTTFAKFLTHTPYAVLFGLKR